MSTAINLWHLATRRRKMRKRAKMRSYPLRILTGKPLAFVANKMTIVSLISLWRSFRRRTASMKRANSSWVIIRTDQISWNHSLYKNTPQINPSKKILSAEAYSHNSRILNLTWGIVMRLSAVTFRVMDWITIWIFWKRKVQRSIAFRISFNFWKPEWS